MKTIFESESDLYDTFATGSKTSSKTGFMINGFPFFFLSPKQRFQRKSLVYQQFLDHFVATCPF